MIDLQKLLTAATTTGPGTAFTFDRPLGAGITRSKATFQGVVTGTGSVTATVLVEVSNDKTNWLTLGTITLSGTTTASDGFAADAPWAWVRGNVTALTGTGAAVALTQGLSK